MPLSDINHNFSNIIFLYILISFHPTVSVDAKKSSRWSDFDPHWAQRNLAILFVCAMWTYCKIHACVCSARNHNFSNMIFLYILISFHPTVSVDVEKLSRWSDSNPYWTQQNLAILFVCAMWTYCKNTCMCVCVCSGISMDMTMGRRKHEILSHHQSSGNWRCDWSPMSNWF